MVAQRLASMRRHQVPTSITLVNPLVENLSIGPNKGLSSPLLPDHEPSPSDTSSRIPKDGVTAIQSREKARKYQLQWGWEFASQLLAVCCTLFITVILFQMNDKPQSRWKFSIAPNSMIAIFSTIAKAALLYPLSECIGQLKWHYFEKAQVLHDMEAFDRASRGPWGATTFLTRRKRCASFATFGALIVILTLAFEPFTQQVISFSTRQVPVSGSGAFITRTNSWVNRASGTWNGWLNNVDFPIEIGIVNAMTGAKGRELLTTSNNAYCPSTQCRYADFTSLAACAKCASNSLNIEHFVCNGSYEHGQADFWENTLGKHLPSIPFSSYGEFKSTIADNLKKWPGYLEVKMRCELPPGNITSFPSVYKFPPFPFNYTFNFSNATYYSTTTAYDPSPEMEERPVSPFQSGCINIHDTSPNDPWDGFAGGLPSISTFTCFNSTTNFSLYTNLNYLGQINGTISRCALDYCVKRYQNNILKNGLVESEHIEEISLNTTSKDYVPHDDNQFLIGTQYTLKALGEQETFVISVDDATRIEDKLVSSTKTFLTSYMSEFIREANANYTQFFTSIADVLSTILQSSYNINATNVTGVSYRADVWVEVRWPWFILPSLLVIASTVFLICTIVQSRKRAYLFKTALLPALFLGGNNVVGGDVTLPRKGKIISDDLSRDVKNVHVRLLEDNDGNLKLKSE